MNGDRVETDFGNHAELLICRMFLYDPRMIERIDAVWGADYEPRIDYAARLHRICEIRIR